MKEENKTQGQLIEELAEWRLQRAEWKAAETRLLAEIQSLSVEKDLFAEFGREVNSELDIDRVYEITANKLAVLVPYDRMVVTLTEVPGDDTRRFVRGVEIKDAGTGMKTRPDHTPTPRRTDGSILYGSVTEAEYFFPEVQAAGLEAWAEVPLGPPESPLGYLSVRSKKKNAYSEADIELLHRISYQISPAFRNARLYLISQRETLERTVLAEELQRQKEWLEVTLSSIGDAVMATDTSETILFMNPVAEALTGWTTQEALGKKVNEVFHIINEQTRQPAEGPIKRVLEEGLIVGLANHTALISRDGREISIADSGAPITGADGVIQGVIMVFRDITDRKQAEEATWVNLALERVRNEVLQMDSEESWDQVVLSFHEELKGLVEFNACSINLVDLRKNRMTAHAVNPEKGGLVRNFREPVPPAVVKTMESGHYEYRRTRRDPLFVDSVSTFPGVHSIIDLPFMGGTLAVNSTEENAFSERDIHILEQFSQVMSEAHRRLQDITERKQMEDGLHASLQREEALGRIRDQMIRATDVSTLLSIIEKSCKSEMIGLGVPVQGMSLEIPVEREGYYQALAFEYYAEYGDTHLSEDRPWTEASPWLADAWETGRPVVVDRKQMEEDGRLRLRAELRQSLVEVPLVEPKGSVGISSREPNAFEGEALKIVEMFVRFIGLGLCRIRDAAAMKQAEEELEQHRDHLEELVEKRTAELEATNKELEAFSYSVSHDLRAPLRHISGFADMLQEDYGSVLDAPGRRHLEVITESAQRMGHLIDDLLTFSRAGRTDMHPTSVDLSALVEDVVQEYGEEIQERILVWEIGDLPMVHADRALLRLVLVNLLDNAVKYTRPRERAEIRIGHRVGDESGTTFFVQDNGVGFDMQYVDQLFGVFQRLHRVEEFEGTGIGLANVQRIIHRHGGRVWAEGAVDGGATFYVFLPVFRER